MRLLIVVEELCYNEYADAHVANVYWSINGHTAELEVIVSSHADPTETIEVRRRGDVGRQGQLVGLLGVDPNRQDFHVAGGGRALTQRTFALRFYLAPLLDELIPRVGRDPRRGMPFDWRGFNVETPDLQAAVAAVNQRN